MPLRHPSRRRVRHALATAFPTCSHKGVAAVHGLRGSHSAPAEAGRANGRSPRPQQGRASPSIIDARTRRQNIKQSDMTSIELLFPGVRHCSITWFHGRPTGGTGCPGAGLRPRPADEAHVRLAQRFIIKRGTHEGPEQAASRPAKTDQPYLPKPLTDAASPFARTGVTASEAPAIYFQTVLLVTDTHYGQCVSGGEACRDRQPER